MKKHFLIITFALLIFVIFVNSVKAAPANSPIFATKEWVEQKIQHLLNTFNQSEQANNTRFEVLEARVSYLESLTPTPTPVPTPTPTPTSTNIVLASNRPASFNQQFDAPLGATSMTFNVSSTDFIINWAVRTKTPGSLDYEEQHRFVCSGGTCPVVTIPVLGTDNLFGLGTSAGLIDASVTINSDPEEEVVLLGDQVSLPYISSPFSTDGYTEIILNAGQENPQNLTGMELQKDVGGIWTTVAGVSCGGAVCNYEILSVDGGNFRVKINGSGEGALLSALLR